MKNQFKALSLWLATLLFLAASNIASAAIERLDVAWSGVTFGNTASATGFMIFDSAALPEISTTGTQFYIPSNEVSDLGISITGASSGNGAFNINDFSSIYFNTPSSLDLSTQLIGQSLSNGSSYGTSTGSFGDGLGGDFNLVGITTGAPYGAWYFKLTTDLGLGDSMLVTSMLVTAVPESPVPAPAAIWLFGSALAGFIGFNRRKLMQQAV